MSDVLAIGPWHTNGELIADVARLGYLDGVVADVTFGEGGFWTHFRPGALMPFDLDPEHGVRVADCRALPLVDGGVDAVVFDPPYKLNGTSTGRGPSALDRRYGAADGYQPVAARHQLLLEGTTEAVRVARRYVLVKCMAQIASGRLHDQPRLVANHAEQLGCELVDEFHLVSPPAPQRSQVHARRNYSTLLVLRAPS